jgi:hypothetical protein
MAFTIWCVLKAIIIDKLYLMIIFVGGNSYGVEIIQEPLITTESNIILII